MAVYLVEHPPATQQYRCPRREHPSGVIGVHTAESFPDESPPDDGAENVARFIANRASYGSYHWLADSDSYLQLIEHDCVAYHIATHGLNEHTIGISAATQAHKWDDLPGWWVDATLRNMARAAADAARWLHREHGITVPARRITLSQALDRQPGFLAHSDADPDRRRDPGRTFPWDDFLDYYAAEMGDTLAWNEDLTPGTPGNDITKLADSILPDGFGRYAADLLGYAASTLPWLRNVKFTKPRYQDEPDKSLTWFIRWDYTVSREGRDAARAAHEQAVKNGEKLDALLDAHAGHDADAIKAHIDRRHAERMAAEGETQAQVAALSDRVEAQGDTLEAMADLLEQHNAGSISPEAVVDGVRDLLHQATAPDGTEDDT